MTATTIRTTCGRCRLTFEAASGALILALPAATADPDSQPSYVHTCPGCSACGSTPTSWRSATYLLNAGATTITAPDVEQIRPRYPERRPASTTDMTLDDLIDLHALLDSDAGVL